MRDYVFDQAWENERARVVAGLENLRLTLEWLRIPLVTSGAVIDGQMDEMFALLSVPGFEGMGRMRVAAWGRKPPL